jgi:FAD/FMN-containing dehydrogenase
MSGQQPEAPLALPNRHRRRFIIVSVCLLMLLTTVIARPLLHLASTAWHDVDGRELLPDGFVDDASRLNRTRVAEVWAVPEDRDAAERQLADLLQRARQDGLRLSIAGARHSMGGHTIFPDGIVIDMLSFNRMELEDSGELLSVQSGALWSDIIPYLDARGRSVAVMQSNNSFSVGGSISVNCHGWQFGRPPIASTVEAFRLMKADGEIVRCSRFENQELFSLVLGGYGLFGIILDVELQTVPNERYRLEQFIVAADQAIPTFDQQVGDNPEAAMVYARMGIAPDEFLQEVILTVFYRDPAPDGDVPKLTEPGLNRLRRRIFRGSVGSDYGKHLRWEAETKLQPHIAARFISRNQLLNEGVDVFENRSADSTDILHEYFVPRNGLVRFVDALQSIVPRNKGDLLNVTIRMVDTDADTYLRYADQPMYAFVMLFNQPRTPAAETAMAALTQELIEAALSAGGRYYLPYRLHATVEQFQRAYPQAERFFELKRQHDPQELFQNQFYLKYGTLAAAPSH